MSTLSSSSTLSQVQAAYDDNASYAEDSDVAKAKLFATAVRILIRRTTTEAQHGIERLRADENLRQFRIELKDARGWISANAAVTAGGAGTKYFSLANFRA